MPEVVASPAERAFAACAAIIRDFPDRETIATSLIAASRQPVTTMAVVELSTLASRGGILDRLEGAGFHVSGPKWK